jgi:hypothetical protein
VSSLRLHEQKASAPNVIAARILRNDRGASNPDRGEKNFGKTEVEKPMARR